jgi:hypothetical protein
MSQGKRLRRQSMPLSALVLWFGLAALSTPSVGETRAEAEPASMEAAASKRPWRKIDVPGARCGDGLGYSIFVSDGDPRKIAFDLMGGGACWDAATCYALPDTWIHPIPTVLESGGLVSTDPARSPLSGHTIVYFPYCTSDVHVGRHVARYAPGLKFHHTGATNFEAALELVMKRGVVDLEHAEQFVISGYSAGALGALYHAFTVDPFVKNVPDKVLIADAPGLHFGRRFWDKFTPELLKDFTAALGRMGMKVEKGKGNLAEHLPKLCSWLPDWRVGVLQGSRDVVMSRVFGSIGSAAHEKLVYGPRGIFEMTKDASDNCSTWTPSTPMHTFLVTDTTASMQASTGESAMDYARDLVQGAWASRGVGGGGAPGGRAAAGPNFR